MINYDKLVHFVRNSEKTACKSNRINLCRVILWPSFSSLDSMEAVHVYQALLGNIAMRAAHFGNMERTVSETVHADEILQKAAAI